MVRSLLMNQRGQSTVEPMLALTAFILAIVLAGCVFHEQFDGLVAVIGEYVVTKLDLL
jgi:hypothetical protein